jgi:hypothetical protein
MSSLRFEPLLLLRIALGELAALASLAGCATSNPDPTCVDFVIGSADLSCNVASDCTFVGALNLCPYDPSCGPENPVNLAGAVRYAQATRGVPLTSVECGAASPVGCVDHVCQIVSPEVDAGPHP